MFMDTDDEGGGAEDQMVETLRMSGVNEADAKSYANAMFSLQPPATFTEVYGTSIFNHNLLSRRNLNIKGLNSLDIRTTKANGSSWDFTKRSDRIMARSLDHIIGRLDG